MAATAVMNPVASLPNSSAIAQALSAGFANRGREVDSNSLQEAIERQLGTDLVGQAFMTQGNTIGQMSATSAPDWLLITSPLIFRYVMMSVDALTAALFRLVRFNRITPNQRLLTLKQVIYNADTWNVGIEYVPGTTQTQTSQSIQTYTQQFVKGISMDLNLFLTPQGYEEYMRQAYQFAVAYALTFVMLIVNALNSVALVKLENPSPLQQSVTLKQLIEESRDIFAAPVKGDMGLNRVKQILGRYNSASQTPLNTLIGSVDLKERLEVSSNSELVVSSDRISISRPPSLPGMEVVGIQPIYVPGSPLDHADLCASRCGFLTYSLCATTVMGGKCNPDSSRFYFYDLSQDRLVSYSVTELNNAAKGTDDGKAVAGKAEDYDYLVITAHLFKTKTPYAMAKDSIGIYSSVPTVLTSASTMRMDVNTQGRFYAGALLENPDGIVPLSHMFVTEVESSPMGFLTAAEIKANDYNLFNTTVLNGKSSVVLRLERQANRRMPSFLPLSLTSYGLKESGFTFDSAQTDDLQKKYAFAPTDCRGANLDLLARMCRFKGFNDPAAATPAIANIDLKTGRFSSPVVMFRGYSGAILRDAADKVTVNDEVNSEAPFGRVVDGLGKILAGESQADSRVHLSMPTPMQRIFKGM